MLKIDFLFCLHLQIATDAQLADRARLEQTIEDLERALRAVCFFRLNLIIVLSESFLKRSKANRHFFAAVVKWKQEISAFFFLDKRKTSLCTFYNAVECVVNRRKRRGTLPKRE